MGLSIFVGLRAAEIPDLRAHLTLYRQAWREARHAAIRASIYGSGLRLDDGAGRDRRAPRESHALLRAPDRAGARVVGRAGAGPADRRRALAERMANLSYGRRPRQEVAFGTPAGVIGSPDRAPGGAGLDGIIAELNPGGRIPLELETRSLRLLTTR